MFDVGNYVAPNIDRANNIAGLVAISPVSDSIVSPNEFASIRAVVKKLAEFFNGRSGHRIEISESPLEVN
jgi:hypothetical protein